MEGVEEGNPEDWATAKQVDAVPGLKREDGDSEDGDDEDGDGEDGDGEEGDGDGDNDGEGEAGRVWKARGEATTTKGPRLIAHPVPTPHVPTLSHPHPNPSHTIPHHPHQAELGNCSSARVAAGSTVVEVQ